MGVNILIIQKIINGYPFILAKNAGIRRIIHNQHSLMIILILKTY